MAPIQEYVGTLIYVGVALFIGVAALLVGALLGPKKPGRAKLMPYESGNDPAGEVKRFPVHFYVVAMLFILFDVDAAFLYPWALIFKELGLFGFVEMMIFMGLLGAGFAYAWKSGAFEW